MKAVAGDRIKPQQLAYVATSTHKSLFSLFFTSPLFGSGGGRTGRGAAILV